MAVAILPKSDLCEPDARNNHVVTIPWKQELIALADDSLSDWASAVRTEGELETSGLCPRCRDTASATVTANTLVVIAGANDRAQFSAPTLFNCNCEVPHPGRPPDRGSGCGACWVGQPTYDNNSGEYSLQAVTDQRLVAAAVRVDEAKASPEEIRSLAEKWIPCIAAVSGTLGLATVVVAADSAKRLDQCWQITALVLVAFAILTAAAATVLVYRAAFGWPKKIDLRNEQDVLDEARRLAEIPTKFVNRMWWAIILSALSLLALLGALGIFWIQPAPTLSVRVTYADSGNGNAEATVCGRFLGVGAGNLRLSVTDAPRTAIQPIPLPDVTKVEQVSTCEG